ncbi:TetR/AcrR family transcriptional regulator [Paenibacillus polysaccharolyticus]|uniref:TetR/AcrR family transcriptional regulator n=1 Tax=Paenibacillus polysaccharolyticus TaxID=582692 RepID=UPI00209F2805|nr:TetR/AcrR family transcriptional regulator [Paenibacillus polysaccharolyticus]MCP1135979.1 TetR/AcrR family transcriptional regulator [Paenibacillus polysaccharolyticus]
MAPKKKFTKDQIIDAAFEIARIEGVDAITIRRVAEKLGSSIAPIYVNFKEVGELLEGVYQKTFEVSRQILLEQNSGHLFQDIGAASIRFARAYPVLFRDIVMQKNDQAKHSEEETGNLIHMMRMDPDLNGLSDDELKTILLKMKTFQVGISVMAANDLLPEDYTEEQMIQLMNSAAQDVISTARGRIEQS